MRTNTTIAIILWLVLLIGVARGDDRQRHQHREHHDYIIERQQAGQVSGVPTTRRIIGRREIDIYPNGLMFEKGNVVGIERQP